MDNYKTRYTSKEADRYGQDIFSGLRKMLKKNIGINPAFDEEIKRLTEAIYINKNNLNWEDLLILEQLANKIYNIK
jgi:hypothetical protein